MVNEKLLMVFGGISIIVGVIALINPLPASLALEIFTGWMFLWLGFIQLVFGFRAREWSGKFWAILLGLVAILAGINLLMEPLEGVVTLTMIVGVLFLLSGLFRLILAINSGKSQPKTTLIFSGLLSLVLGIMIISSIATSAGYVLGTLLGIELIFSGIGVVALGSLYKNRFTNSV